MKALTAALVLIAASSGLAQAGEEKPKAPTDGQYIDVSAVALPVIVDGLVRNYVFVAIRVDLTSSANTSKLREKEPYFRDAVVRAAHRTPFNKPGDLNHIDETRVVAALSRDAGSIIGPGAFKAVRVLSQTPKTWVISDVKP
jgi:hypothetical protein